MAKYSRYRGYFGPAADGSWVWSPSLKTTTVNRPSALQTKLEQVASYVDQGLKIPQQLLPVAQFLVEEGYLSESKANSVGLEVSAWHGQPLYRWTHFQAEKMSQIEHASWHLFTNDGHGNGWLYNFSPNQSPCLECLLRRWLAYYRLGKGFEALWQAGPIDWAPGQQERLMPDVLPTVGQVAYYEAGLGWKNCPLDQIPACKKRLQFCHGLPRELSISEGTNPFAVVSSLQLWPSNEHNYTIAVARTSALQPTGALASGSDIVVGGGCDVLPERALRSAYCEAVERYCAFFPGRLSTRAWRKSDLPWVPRRYRKDGELAQHNPRVGQIFEWVVAQRLGSKQGTVEVTSTQVYLCPNAQAQSAPGHSHGLACGSTKEQAILAGMWELVERDAVARFWATFLKTPQQCGFRVDAAERDCIFIYPPSIAGTTVICLLQDQGRPVFGSASQWHDCPEKAYREAVHNLEFLRNYCPDPIEGPPTSFPEHLAYYWHLPNQFPWRSLDQIPVQKPTQTATLNTLEAPDSQSLADWLERQGISTAYIDLTTDDSQNLGLTVVRVLAPQLLSHPQEHQGWPVGLPRWGELFDNRKLPQLPHPFG